jgi:hypothetical protein
MGKIGKMGDAENFSNWHAIASVLIRANPWLKIVLNTTRSRVHPWLKISFEFLEIEK